MTPADQAARDRLQTDLDSTLFVEAGAGSGKTQALASRIVALLASGRVTAEGLVAITFTERAAAELRDRVRQLLEAAPADERCRQALGELDLASIQTIHSFAATLLRTFPLEAGLPPGFAIWDELERDHAFEAAFRGWLYDQVPADSTSAVYGVLRRALDLGLRLDQVRALAGRLQDHSDLLATHPRWEAGQPADAVACAQEVGALLSELEAHVGLAHDGEADPLVQELRAVRLTVERLAAARDEKEALAAFCAYENHPPSTNLGNQESWDETEGQNGATRFKAAFRRAKARTDYVLTGHRTAALAHLLDHLRDFTLAGAEERRAQGAATFHDLLVWARDLLRDNPDVRRRAHARFQRILVDEFQDTDPLQVEIAWLLASNPEQAAERDWRKLDLVAGKLFLVGDPKQSIYRFRRADLATFAGVYDRLASDQRVHLTQNFRSVPRVLTWVNYQLGHDMQARSRVSPAYEDLQPCLQPADRGGVYHIGEVVDKAPVKWRREAEAAARLAHRIVRERWQVSDGQGGWRDARDKDICLLLPTRTNLRRLERALDAADVPYRMESGSLILHTQEVRDLLSCLRAIDDPSDQVALVAALRSPAYACSDVDLLAWVDAGGRLDYEQPSREEADPHALAANPVAAALESLLAFHRQAWQRPAAATVEAFIEDRGLVLQALGQPRPRDAWRRLRYVADQARRLASAGQPWLRSVVDWLEGLQAGRLFDVESPAQETDEDAVRLLTVHAAKGLEFPIVILTGLGAAPPALRGPDVLADHQTGRLEVRIGPRWRTTGYEPEHERAVHEAEQVRLLYVAATRARDHLVLSLFHHGAPSPAKRILERLEQAPPDLVLRLEDEPWAPPEPQPAFDEPEVLPPDEHAAQERAWLASREALIRRLGSQRHLTPSGLAHALGQENGLLQPANADESLPVPSPLPEGKGTGLPLGRGSTALGRAVHATLQLADLAQPDGLPELAAHMARGYGIPTEAAEVQALSRAVIESPALAAARAAKRLWREVPVGIELDGTLLEGFIDLLHESPTGELTVVDYKSDHIRPDEANARAAEYRLQGGAYALALEQATGRRVAQVQFVFAALNGHVVTYTGSDLRAIVAEARARLE